MSAGEEHWSKVLGVSPDADKDAVMHAWRLATHCAHNKAAFDRVQRAWDQFLYERSLL